MEYQIQLRLDNALTRAKIANRNKVAAAGNIPAGGGLGLPGIGDIGTALSGGGLALGVASAIFPTEVGNLFSGIGNVIKSSGIVEGVQNALSGGGGPFQPIVIQNVVNEKVVSETEVLRTNMKADGRL